jgi:hypothetical protein
MASLAVFSGELHLILLRNHPFHCPLKPSVASLTSSGTAHIKPDWQLYTSLASVPGKWTLGSYPSPPSLPASRGIPLEKPQWQFHLLSYQGLLGVPPVSESESSVKIILGPHLPFV